MEQQSPKAVKVYADGGSRGNPGPSASGFVVLDMNDKVLFRKGVYLGITTNNQAEYRSIKFGLETAKQMGCEQVTVFMDSQLAIRQINGIYRVKNKDIKPVYDEVMTLAKQFNKISFTHVPRELNKLADREVNKALDAEAKR
ncbi:MAG TPA: ribonuclease HI family protein [Candidatus Saccharimonadales bacterium]|nr:ribonuclease HI family protein [Candidatus Saccharimonadales bacterium]